MNTGDHSALKDELRDDAKSLGNAARGRVESEVDGRKGMATKQVKSAASALETAGRELDDDSPEWLRSALRSGSQSLQRMADQVENKSSRELMDDVQRMARNNPVMFWGLCAAAGFAAVRVMKAGADTGQQGNGGRNWDRSDRWDDNSRNVSLRRETQGTQNWQAGQNPSDTQNQQGADKPQDEPAKNSDYRDQAGYGRAPMPDSADKLNKPPAETQSW